MLDIDMTRIYTEAEISDALLPRLDLSIKMMDIQLESLASLVRLVSDVDPETLDSFKKLKQLHSELVVVVEKYRMGDFTSYEAVDSFHDLLHQDGICSICEGRPLEGEWGKMMHFLKNGVEYE